MLSESNVTIRAHGNGIRTLAAGSDQFKKWFSGVEMIEKVTVRRKQNQATAGRELISSPLTVLGISP